MITFSGKIVQYPKNFQDVTKHTIKCNIATNTLVTAPNKPFNRIFKGVNKTSEEIKATIAKFFSDTRKEDKPSQKKILRQEPESKICFQVPVVGFFSCQIINSYPG